jgi:hypothetical protein
VALTWAAAADNVGVSGYNIYRSTTSGFSPSGATFIARVTSGTTYTDPVAAGTYYYLVTAYDAAGNESAPSNQAAGVSSQDTQPPTVTVTSPAPGAVVAGVINLAATASDNGAVAGVQFELDGSNIGPLLTSAPYTLAWNTATATNGSHTLTAVASDASGNTATSSPVALTVSNTSLIASYAFDETIGTTTADGSGNGNTGTLENVTRVPSGKYGGALSFNGTTSVVTVNDAPSLRLTAGMTLEAWVNPSSLNSPDLGWCAVIAKDRTAGGNDIDYALDAAAGNGTPPGVHVTINGADSGAGGGGVLSLNSWTFLAGTYDGATLRMYVNGTLVASKAVAGSIGVTTDPLKIGGDLSNEMFTGLIDNVRVYNQALSQAQIQSDMTTAAVTAAPAQAIAMAVGGAGLTRIPAPAAGNGTAPSQPPVVLGVAAPEPTLLTTSTRRGPTTAWPGFPIAPASKARALPAGNRAVGSAPSNTHVLGNGGPKAVRQRRSLHTVDLRRV